MRDGTPKCSCEVGIAHALYVVKVRKAGTTVEHLACTIKKQHMALAKLHIIHIANQLHIMHLLPLVLMMHNVTTAN